MVQPRCRQHRARRPDPRQVRDATDDDDRGLRTGRAREGSAPSGEHVRSFLRRRPRGRLGRPRSVVPRDGQDRRGVPRVPRRGCRRRPRKSQGTTCPDDVEAQFVRHDARSAPAGLLQLAEEYEANMVVLGSSSAGLFGHVALGSVTDRLVHSSPVSIALATRGFRCKPGSKVARATGGLRRVRRRRRPRPGCGQSRRQCRRRVPDRFVRRLVDGRRTRRRSAPARRTPCSQSGPRRWRRWRTRHLHTVEELSELPRKVETAIGRGETWAEALDDIGWEQGDVLVVGSSGIGPVAQVFLGSRATKILRHSPVPVVVVPRAVRRSWRMHEIDQTTEQMVRSVLAYAENRLRMDPVPLDIGTLPAEELNAAAGRPDPRLRATPGRGARRLLVGDRARASSPPTARGSSGSSRRPRPRPACCSTCSCPAPRSRASRGSRRPARSRPRTPCCGSSPTRPGCPQSAGGCFVSGGSAGNLSTLAVARETAKKRLGAAGRGPAAPRRRRHRRALLDREHPAAAGDGRPRGRDPRPPDDRGQRAGGDRGRPRPVRHRRRGLHLRHHQRRHRRRPRWRRDAREGTRLVVPRRRRVRRLRDLREVVEAEVRRPRAGRLVHPRSAQVAVHAVRLLRGALPGPRAGARRTHPGRVVPRRHPRLRRGVEPDRLRLPPDQASPRPAAVVLARRLRRRRLPGGDRGGREAGSRDRRPDQGRHPSSS